MRNSKTNLKSTNKVSNSAEKKVDLINLANSIKEAKKSKKGNVEGIYIFSDSEMQKANEKLSFYQNKFKGITDLSKNEKRKLSLKNHLSSTRSKIRNEFESMLINYFRQIDSLKLNNADKKEVAKNVFLDFFKSRFVKFEESKKIYSDMLCNNGNSLSKKIDSLCEIWNK